MVPHVLQSFHRTVSGRHLAFLHSCLDNAIAVPQKRYHIHYEIHGFRGSQLDLVMPRYRDLH